MRTIAALALVGLAVGSVPILSQPLGPAPGSAGPVAALAPVNGKDLDLSPEEATNVRVYQQANASVANITTRGVDDADFNGLRRGTGSGCVLTKAGHILTNFHVIDGADQVTVTLADGNSYTAKLAGTDPNNDLAVLKIAAPASRLVPIAWGDSDKLLVGVRVYVLGNPFGLERTMTAGMVSSLGRTLRAENGRLIRGVIQTDAAINPGNSGGPLLNRRGELVGITTAIISRAGQSSGVGMAVPGNTARRVVDELIRFGRVVRTDCGIEAAQRTDQGLRVARLTEGGPAERAGVRGPETNVIRRGGAAYLQVDRSKADIVVAVDGKAVKTLDELLTAVESRKPGDDAVFTVIREGVKQDIKVRLAQSGE